MYALYLPVGAGSGAPSTHRDHHPSPQLLQQPTRGVVRGGLYHTSPTLPDGGRGGGGHRDAHHHLFLLAPPRPPRQTATATAAAAATAGLRVRIL